MKYLLFLFSFALITNILISRDLVAVTDGDWTDPATWGGFVPQAGDNIVIPSGITVQVTTNEHYEGSPIMITLDGTLEFVGGGSKLFMPCGTEIDITETGQIVPTGVGAGASEQIVICNEVVWQKSDGIVAGPIILKQSTLPVELISFIGFVEDNTIKLEWTTASEINNDYFQVEKSTNGIDFNTLTVVSGSGNSNKMNDYYTYDELPTRGTMYYRLKQVDYDGKFEYTDLLSVNFEEETKSDCKFTVMPNPCISKCILKLTDCAAANNENFTFYIYDAIGNAVLASSPQLINNGEARFSFDSSNKLKPGMYIVRGSAKEKIIEDKMIINK